MPLPVCVDCGKPLSRYDAKRCRLCFGAELSKKRLGSSNPFFGKKHTEDYFNYMSGINSGSNNPMYGVTRLGEDSPGWKGGVTPLSKSIRSLDKYGVWRFDVYSRDKFECRVCGIIGVYLECHHIISLSDMISTYNIKNIEDAISCSFLWDINNGLTVCVPCHCDIDKERSKFERIEV